MHIALIGYGKMGKEVEKMAIEQGHTLSIIAPNASKKEISQDSVGKIDVAIDFSTPSAVLENVRKLATLKKNIIIGTTGWDRVLPEIKQIVEQSGIGFLYSPNFSIGVNLFFKVVEEAAKLMNHYEQFDVSGFEQHHRQKVDAPSGTAKALCALLMKNIERKKQLLFDQSNLPLEPQQLHFSSLRCGTIPGNHTILFDSPHDTITINHQAKNRQGFAAGALFAAEWIEGKTGFYTMKDIL